MKSRSKRSNLLIVLSGVWILVAFFSCSKDDPVSPPPVENPGEETVQIGNDGGTVTIGDATITVPAGYLPYALPFTLTKVKSFAQDATYTLDPAAYQPMGIAYQFDTPLRSSVPLTLTIYFETEDIPQGFDVANLGIVQRVTSYPEALGSNEPSVPQPEVHYLPIPAMVSLDSGTVTFELFEGGTYQLAAMSEVPETYEFSIETGGMKTAGAMGTSKLDFVISHSVRPVMDPATFDKSVEDAIRKSYAKYESMGFSLPQGTIRIVVMQFRGGDVTVYGSVPRNNPLRIQLSSKLNATAIPYTVAHEYFHCIQYYNTNYVSLVTYWSQDWFWEGSANWAQDEVYDEIPGVYWPPTADRFRKSLNAIPPPNGGYDAVAFWKWLESKYPGVMWSIFENQRLLTSDERFSALGIPVINMVLHSYEASLREVRPDLPFLSFFRSSLFYKDYEEDEVRVDGKKEDLWGPNKLGPPNTLAPGLPEPGKTVILAKGEPGDGEDNPRRVDFDLGKHLTADVFVVQTTLDENALEGTLHVEFEPDPRGPFEAAVIAYNGTNVVDDVSVAVSKTAGASATVEILGEYEVAVITVDPNWKDTGRGVNRCEVWVAKDSPCGELEEPILDIDNVEALVAALESPPSSGTIRLAPGDYYPQSREWDDLVDPQYDTRWANLMLNGVTLAGSTEGETRIVLRPNPDHSNVGIFVQGNACVRDLVIDGSTDNDYIFQVDNTLEFELCNVTMTDYSHEVGNTIIFYYPWDPGTFNFSVHDCTIRCQNYVSNWYWGIDLAPFRWSSTGGPAPVINFELKRTEFYNLGCGVGFDNSDPVNTGTVVIDTDCYFFSNVDHNVYDWGSKTELCP